MSGSANIKVLAAQLPRDGLSHPAASALAAALRDGSEEALRSAVRAAVDELLEQRVLVRVALADRGLRRPPLYLIRDTSRMLDLSPLGSPPPAPAALAAADGGEAPQPQPIAVPARRPSPATTPPDRSEIDGNGGLDGLLEAMERAQDLAVGDPRVSKPAVMVDRILGLLRDYTPGVRLHVQFFLDMPADDCSARLLPSPSAGEMPIWWRHRRPGQALWIPDQDELPNVLKRVLTALPSRDLVTAVIPLIGPTEPYEEVGLLYVSAGPSWSQAELFPLARRLSSFVTRRWRCQLDVNQRVLTDALTGIHNRAFFDTQFPLELERASRAGLPLTLAIADLDDFKAVNDRHGHQCGDLVLRAVAQQLQSRLRRIDHICRIGGEEFACLLPATSVDEAREVLTRVVSRGYRVVLPSAMGIGALDITASYGAVTFPAGGQSASELHRKADRMLYQAKELGRARCCLWIAEGRYEQLTNT